MHCYDSKGETTDKYQVDNEFFYDASTQRYILLKSWSIDTYPNTFYKVRKSVDIIVRPVIFILLVIFIHIAILSINLLHNNHIEGLTKHVLQETPSSLPPSCVNKVL